MSPRAKERERLLEEVRQTQDRAQQAIAELDITAAISLCRALRSLAWRGKSLGLDVAALTLESPSAAEERI